jgi:hypothetical protein
VEIRPVHETAGIVGFAATPASAARDIASDFIEERSSTVKIRSVLRQSAVLALIFIACNSRAVLAQTPSPLQEWQYSGGIILARLFQPDLPTWRTILGVAAETQPVYDGSRAYRVQGGPVVNIHYKDIAFISTGEGIGYNFLRGDHYQIGLGVTYDFGRKEKWDLTNLHGMGDIGAAPEGKLYA